MCSLQGLLVLFIFTHVLVSGQEIIHRTFCWNEDFRLDCNWRSILAIHEAYFTNDPHEVNVSSCQQIADQKSVPLCREDVKASFNKRCSGMSHCHYNLTEDHRQRQCYCKGIISLRFACVPEVNLTQSCNTKVLGQTGYISSPGYPRFYPKVHHCSWSIEESSGQEMMLTFLDMDTRPPTRMRVVNNCPDSITIYEDFHKLRYTCGSYTNETQKPLITSGKRIHFEFSSLDFMPSRGFLLYYKVHGCPTLDPPRLGYMVYRNKSSALYMCCKDHVFNNTQSNMLHLRCENDMRWNGTVPPCLSLEGNNTKLFEEIKLDIVEVYMSRNKYLEEILIPTACVVGLVFGHVAAIILAMKIRKTRKSSSTSQNEQLQPSNASAPAIPTIAVIPRAPTVLITDL